MLHYDWFLLELASSEVLEELSSVMLDISLAWGYDSIYVQIGTLVVGHRIDINGIVGDLSYFRDNFLAPCLFL